MYRTKSYSGKEMLTLKSYQPQKQNLRSLVADKTRRYHEHLQKFALRQFSYNQSSWGKKNKNPQEIREFQTTPSEEIQSISEEDLSNISIKQFKNTETSPQRLEIIQYCQRLKTQNHLYKAEISSLKEKINHLQSQLSYKQASPLTINPQFSLTFNVSEGRSTGVQTQLFSEDLCTILTQKQQLQQFLNNYDQKSSQSIVQRIQKIIEERLSPCINEVSLLKSINMEIKNKYEQKLKLYGKLLIQAQNQIQKLLRKLREAKQDSIESFRAYLHQHKQLNKITIQEQ